MIKFIVHTNPIPKARPQFDSRHKRTYTKQSTKEWEAVVRHYCVLAFRHIDPYQEPVKVSLRFYRKGAADLDNLVKSALDGMNGVAWDDDRRVLELHAYLIRKAKPYRLEVEVSPIV